MFTFPVGFFGGGSKAFVFTVDTSIAGTSGVNHFQLPFKDLDTYNCTVDWGDGTSDTITTYNQAETDHDYGAASIYTITITGTFPHFQFINVGDKQKIQDVIQSDGLNVPTGHAFNGCTNLTWSATDAPVFSGTSVFNMFNNCTNVNPDVSNWDVSGIEDFGGFFRLATSFTGVGLSNFDTSSATDMNNMLSNTAITGGVNGFDMSSVTNITSMLANADSFDESLAAWDIQSLTTATNFMVNATGMSTANYDATLIGWDANTHNNTVTVHFGGSTYTSGGAAETARTNLIGDAWTITDGGAAP